MRPQFLHFEADWRWPRRATLAVALCGSLPAFAGPWSFAALSAQGVDTDLLELLPRAVEGSLRREPSYANGGIAARRIEAPTAFTAFCGRVGIETCSLSWEASLLRHSGRQHQPELAGGLKVGLGDLTGGGWHLAFATTQGLSYAFGRPGYEDGPRGDPDRRYRLQYHMAFEIEISHDARAGVSAGLRVHHRSGMYGLIAPPRVGSNFIGLVVRYTP